MITEITYPQLREAIKKFLIRETKQLLTNADYSTDTKKILLVRQKSLKIKLFARQFYTLYEQKYSNPRPLLSISFPQGFENPKSLDIGFWEVGAKDV